jgi:hypothetical protein
MTLLPNDQKADRKYHLEAKLMPDVLEQFAKETIEELLKEMPPEERLKGLPAEERLKGLPAEERLKGLPAEERVKGLSADEILAALSPEMWKALGQRLQEIGKPDEPAGK